MDVAVAPASSGPDAPPPLMATHGSTTSFGSPPSDGDLDLQWDQTYLRINYIVRNLAGPVPLQLHHQHQRHLYPGHTYDDAMSDSSSQKQQRPDGRDPASPDTAARSGQQPLGGPQHHHSNPVGFTGDSFTPGLPGHAPGAVAGGASGPKRPGGDSPAAPKAAPVQAWPALPHQQAAQRHARISVWTREVSDLGENAYCACSAPWAAARLRLPAEGAGDHPCSGTTVRGLLPAALVAGSAGGFSALASPAASTAGAGNGVCRLCQRPLDPAENMATGSRSNSSYSQDGVVVHRDSGGDEIVGGDAGEGGSAAKKALSRVQRVLHRFRRRSRAKSTDLPDLVTENDDTVHKKKNGADSNGNSGTNGERSATHPSLARNSQGQVSGGAMTAAATAPASNATLMYRAEASEALAAENESAERTVRQPQNQQAGPSTPAGQGRHASSSGLTSESSLPGQNSAAQARSSAARLERARRLLNSSHSYPLAHPPPPPTRGSKS